MRLFLLLDVCSGFSSCILFFYDEKKKGKSFFCGNQSYQKLPFKRLVVSNQPLYQHEIFPIIVLRKYLFQLSCYYELPSTIEIVGNMLSNVTKWLCWSQFNKHVQTLLGIEENDRISCGLLLLSQTLLKRQTKSILSKVKRLQAVTSSRFLVPFQSNRSGFS